MICSSDVFVKCTVHLKNIVAALSWFSAQPYSGMAIKPAPLVTDIRCVHLLHCIELFVNGMHFAHIPQGTKWKAYLLVAESDLELWCKVHPGSELSLCPENLRAKQHTEDLN